MKQATLAGENSRSSRLPTDAITQVSIARTASGEPQYAICIDNSDYPVSLELHKIYQILPSPKWEEEGYVRLVDESGEDYVYPARRFLRVKLPQTVRAALSKTQADQRIPPK